MFIWQWFHISCLCELLFFYLKYYIVFYRRFHRLGKFIFHKFVGTDICCGHSWQFFEAFLNSVHIDIGIISYRPKLRNISWYKLAISSSPNIYIYIYIYNHRNGKMYTSLPELTLYCFILFICNVTCILFVCYTL